MCETIITWMHNGKEFKTRGLDSDKTKPPKHYYDRCIRCYCCQETCPEEAISIESPLLGRLFFRS